MSEISVVLQMEGNYPSISSGVVSFENTRTGSKVSIRAKDLGSGIHDIKSIVIGIEDENGNKLERKIMRFFLTNYAPSITSEGRLLARKEHQPHTDSVRGRKTKIDEILKKVGQATNLPKVKQATSLPEVEHAASLLSEEVLKKVFRVFEKVNVNLSKLYENIDVPETLSNLFGSEIRKISANEVELENGEKMSRTSHRHYELDYKTIKPSIWW